MTSRNTCKCQDYDVVIIGAGPAGLATLSALQEPFTLDHLSEPQWNQILSSKGQRRKICVIDPSGDWMTSWNQNFSKLDISFLRSPALAHPDAFDQTALLAYAIANGRGSELKASGCSDLTRLQGLEEAHNGLWNMPSTKLFRDFCCQTATALPHDFCKDAVSDVQPMGTSSRDSSYSIVLKSGARVTAKSVVLAMGALGEPIIPRGVANVPNPRMIHWKDLNTSTSSPDDKEGGGIPFEWKDILVVGGGLAAVQVAQLALKCGNSLRKVTLCSRRPLMEKHLDIGLDRVDRRHAQKCQSDFYHQPVERRLAMLQEARWGGSVPPYYVRQVEDLESQGRLQRLVGNPNFIYSEKLVLPDSFKTHAIDNNNNNNNNKTGGGTKPCHCFRRNAPLVVGIGRKIHRFDGIIVACGMRPNCRRNPVCESILRHSSLDASEMTGFPIISEDLEWIPNVFVVGSMASLNLGPDAGNLMGMRRGATLVANALGCRSWLRETGNLFANRYSLFEEDSDFSSSDDEEENDSNGE